MMTSTSKESLQAIQLQYYNLLDAFYGKFYEQYRRSGMDANTFLEDFLSGDKLHHIRISEGNLLFENQLVDQMLNFKSTVSAFWKENIEEVKTLLNTCGSIGYFGTIENNSTLKYESTIKQNAVFFDLVALNDPFSEVFPLDTKVASYTGVTYLFYESVLSVYSVRPYVLNKEDLIAAIIPTSAIIQYSEQCDLMDKAHNTALDVAKQLFGIDYSMGDHAQCLKILKSFTDEQIADILLTNGINVNLYETQQYEKYALDIEGREQLLNLSRMQNGDVNWDFVRCVLNYGAIPNILTVTFAVHAIHSAAALKTGMHPIFNAFEWYPNKYYYEKIPPIMGSTDEYKYVCAIQRNEKLAQVVQMDLPHLLKFRDKNESCKFRRLFHSATCNIIATPDCFSEIAESVFANLQKVLDQVETEREKQDKEEVLSSLFGLGKAVCGFVPIVSSAIGIYDVGKSMYQLHKDLSKEADVVDFLLKSNSNILSTNARAD